MLLPHQLIQGTRAHPNGQGCISSWNISGLGFVASKQSVGHGPEYDRALDDFSVHMTGFSSTDRWEPGEVW